MDKPRLNLAGLIRPEERIILGKSGKDFPFEWLA
jgi:hypothetical protein